MRLDVICVMFLLLQKSFISWLTRLGALSENKNDGYLECLNTNIRASIMAADVWLTINSSIWNLRGSQQPQAYNILHRGKHLLLHIPMALLLLSVDVGGFVAWMLCAPDTACTSVKFLIFALQVQAKRCLLKSNVASLWSPGVPCGVSSIWSHSALGITTLCPFRTIPLYTEISSLKPKYSPVPASHSFPWTGQPSKTYSCYFLNVVSCDVRSAISALPWWDGEFSIMYYQVQTIHLGVLVWLDKMA